MSQDFDIVGFTVENLRGFRKAHLSLDRPVTILVGPNNAGKTSLLRLLEWSIAGVDRGLLEGRRRRTAAEDELLLPARNSQSRARRLTLHIAVRDGRRHRKLKCDKQGVSRLRLRIVGDGVYAAVSKPSRSETLESEPAALELWQAVHADSLVVHVPAARDASSSRFSNTLNAAVRVRLEERAIHEVRGGAPAEYRKLKKASDTIRKVGHDLVSPLWDELETRLPPGLVSTGTFTFGAEPNDLVEWLVDQAVFKISTGPHDENTVSPDEVGSGLQSLLDLALLESVEGLVKDSWLLLEEPEAFLHPSAQRQLAESILGDRSVRRIVSTHSPIIVDESRYGEVVLVRDHRLFEPEVSDERRAEINTALMGGSGAEALFARSVLLVEGPGDKAFFEALRRRLAALDESGRAFQLGIVAVGGKARFGPWIRLLQSYSDSQGELPIRWLAVADSIDAAADLARGLRDAGITLPQNVSDLVRDQAKVFQDNGADAGIQHTRRLNAAARKSGTRMALLPVDLEYAALGTASDETCERLASRLGLEDSEKKSLLAKLGCKYENPGGRDAMKHDWIRGELAAFIPAAELSPDVTGVLSLWLEGVMARKDASTLLQKL